MNPIQQYPFNFFRDGGGAFIATAESEAFTGFGAGAMTKSYRWKSDKFTLRGS